MKIRILFSIVCVGITLASFSGPGHSKKIEKKVRKEVSLYFGTEEFSLETIKISPDQCKSVKSEFEKDNLSKIMTGDHLLGYAYIGNAPSKTATFDYLVIFDTDFTILKSKVLIYREEYGGEIGSKRWLKQFNGKTKEDSLKFPEDVDAISGATISVRSMTKSMNELLNSLKILHKNNAI